MTVLLHVWTTVPAAAEPLRDDALALLRGRTCGGGLVSRGRREYPLRGLIDGVSLYPLDLAVSVGDVSRSPRLELCRQGLDEDIVVLKAMGG